MTKSKWYTPQLSRQIVGKLYAKAKAERIPMTKLANRLVQRALDTEGSVDPARSSIGDVGSSAPRSVVTR